MTVAPTTRDQRGAEFVTYLVEPVYLGDGSPNRLAIGEAGKRAARRDGFAAFDVASAVPQLSGMWRVEVQVTQP